MKKVYVIVPVFNVEKYLSKCLDSLVGQTYENITILCVNDGSNDSSLAILNDYKKRYSNIIVVNKTNGGLSSARNFGLDYGLDIDSYLMFVDSDDWLDLNYIKKMVDTLEFNNADIVCSDYFDVEESGEIAVSQNINEEILKFDSFNAVEALFLAKIQSHGPCKLYKTSLWLQVRYDESIIFLEDQSTIFKTFLNAETIIHTSYKGYYYFHRLGSICQSYMSNKKILSALKSYLYVCQYSYNFEDEKNKKIALLSFVLFIKAFLMLYPRFHFDSAVENEKNQMLFFCKEVKNSRINSYFKLLNFKNKFKLLLFLFSSKFYKWFYSFFLKKYDY